MSHHWWDTPVISRILPKYFQIFLRSSGKAQKSGHPPVCPNFGAGSRILCSSYHLSELIIIMKYGGRPKVKYNISLSEKGTSDFTFLWVPSEVVGVHHRAPTAKKTWIKVPTAKVWKGPPHPPPPGGTKEALRDKIRAQGLLQILEAFRPAVNFLSKVLIGLNFGIVKLLPTRFGGSRVLLIATWIKYPKELKQFGCRIGLQPLLKTLNKASLNA